MCNNPKTDNESDSIRTWRPEDSDMGVTHVSCKTIFPLFIGELNHDRDAIDQFSQHISACSKCKRRAFLVFIRMMKPKQSEEEVAGMDTCPDSITEDALETMVSEVFAGICNLVLASTDGVDE